MDFKLHNDVKAFYASVYDVLLGAEAQNMIILGNLIIGYEGKDIFGWRNPQKWMMATIDDGDGICLVALMTPPYGITLYAVGNFEAAIKCLVDGLVAAEIAVPAVMSEKSLAIAFADEYCEKLGLNQQIRMRSRMYELSAVSPDVPKIGNFRAANEADLSFMPFWYEDFFLTAMGQDSKIDSDIEKYRHIVAGDRTYVLEDGGCAVSVAQISRRTAGAACVSYVYTPPYFRGRGYASSVVAHLSQKCLDDGFKSCVLYTDLANPTSNSIYQKIGYTPMCDSLEIKFTL